jgi:hypothetical protein
MAEETRRTRYRLGMAGRKGKQGGDVISRLADAGEDALRRLVDLPRRPVVGAIDRVEGRLHHVAARLRGIDPLYGRVVAIEKRLDSLEKPPKRSTRRTSTRTTSPAARRPRAALAIEPDSGESEVGRHHDTRADAELEAAEVMEEHEPVE